MHPQPRCYRIRLFKKTNREALNGQEYTYVLDFSPGPGLRATQGQLEALVQALAHKDGARGKDMLNYHLEVEDYEDKRQKKLWPATTWLDDTY